MTLYFSFSSKLRFINMHEANNNNTVIKSSTKNTTQSRQWHLVWHTVIFFTLMHIGSAYGIYLLITKTKWQTIIFGKYLLYYFVFNFYLERSQPYLHQFFFHVRKLSPIRAAVRRGRQWVRIELTETTRCTTHLYFFISHFIRQWPEVNARS